MAQYDGSIRINTQINTDGLRRGEADIRGSMGRIARTVDDLSSSMSRVTKAAKRLVGVIAVTFAARKLVEFGKEAIQLGSDLQEVQNVVDVTFTRMSNKVNEFAKNAATAAGLSETMAKRYVGTFGAMAKSFGFTEEAAYEMSNALTQLSGDVASFYNISQDEAYTKLKSVFTGETETLKDLGVVMTQAALDQYALAKGIGETTSAMTEQEKVTLRYRFVLDQLSAASGDFIRTSDSWANQTRILKLQIDSLKATIGQGLINLFTPIIKQINVLLGKLATLANAFKSFTELITGKKSSAGNKGAAGGGLAASESEYQKSADAAEELAESTENVADATKDAEKAAKGYLSPLDEINRYTKNISDEGEIDLGIGGGLGENIDYGSLAEGETVVDGLIDKFKSLYEIGKFIGEKLKKALDSIPWDKIKENARKFGEGIAELINGFVEVEGLGYSIGRTLAEEINTAFEFFNSFVHTLHWDSVGKFIADQIMGFTKNIDWDLIQDTFITQAEGLAELLNNLISPELFGEVGRTIAEALNSKIYAALAFGKEFDFEKAGESIATAINDFFVTFDFTSLAETLNVWVDGLEKALIKAIKTLDIDKISQELTNLLSNLEIDTVAVILGAIAIKKVGIFGVADAIKRFLSGLTIANLPLSITSFAPIASSPAFAMIGLWIVDELEKIIPKTVSDFFGKLIAGFSIGGIAGSWVPGIGTAIGGVIGAAIAAIPLPEPREFFPIAFSWFDKAAEAFTEAFNGEKKSFWEIGGLIVQGIIDGIIGALASLFEPIWNLFVWIYDTICDVFGISSPAKEMMPIGEYIVSGLLEGISGAMSTISSWINEHIFRPFIDAFKNCFGIHSPSTVMKEQGGNIITGMLNGITEKLRNIASWIRSNIFNPFTNAFKNLFGIHSPSTVMRGFGNDIVSGLLNGLRNAWNSVVSWINDKVGWIIDKVNSAIDSLHRLSGISIGGGFFSRYGGAGRSLTYSVQSLMPDLSNIEIPGYATGQVIPRAMRKHLAILGDNNRETEVVSPLSTIEQAVENVAARLGGLGGMEATGRSVRIEIPVILNRKELTRAVVDEAKFQQILSGKNIFDLT